MASKADAEQTDTIQRSLAAQKGHLTRAVTALKGIIAASDAPPGSSTIAEVKSGLAKVKEHQSKIVARYGELIRLNPDNADELTTKMNAEGKEADQVIIAAVGLLNLQVAVPVQAATEGFTKPNEALKPPTLKKDDSPVVFASWKDRFGSYYRTSNFQKLEIPDQQSYFLSCLDSTLQMRLKRDIHDTLPVFSASADIDSCLRKLEHIFQTTNPIFARRIDFFRQSHTQNTSFTDFLVRLRAAAEEANLSDLDFNGLIAMKGVAACQDEELNKIVLREKNLNLARLEELAEQREVEIASLQVKHRRKGEGAIANVVRAGARRQHNGNSSGSKKKNGANAKTPQWRAEFRRLGKCERCAKSHDIAKCTYPADVVCTWCQKKNHIQPACQRKAQGSPRATSAPTKSNANAATTKMVKSSSE